MPEQKTIKRAQADKRAGKASSTQAGEFVKEQVDKVRAGKHGVRSAKQAIAIGLSEARRAGVAVKSPKKGTASEATRKKADKDNAAGSHKSTAKRIAELPVVFIKRSSDPETQQQQRMTVYSAGAVARIRATLAVTSRHAGLPPANCPRRYDTSSATWASLKLSR